MSLEAIKNISLDNKYTHWYCNLINKSIERNWKKGNGIYLEGHHVVPKSISGDTLRSGFKVYLTAREHYICHLLLPKMLEGENKRKMLFALHRLCTGNKKNYIKSSFVYETIKQNMCSAAKIRSKEYWDSLTQEQKSFMRAGEKNSRWGAIVTEETRKKISESNKGRFSGSKHPLYGKGHSEYTKNKISMSKIGKKLLHRWYHDGKNNFRLLPEEATSNLTLGKLNNLRWYNNGIKNFYILPENIKEGYIKGRINWSKA